MTAQSMTFIDHAHVAQSTEKCEHHLRSRRTYREVANTPGAAIIEVAGPKAWPKLSERQQEMVESRERERQAEAAQVARFEGEAERSVLRSAL